MDKYYLKINLVYKNNKRYFNTCELYKKNKLIKTYDRDISKQIHKLAKENNIDIVNVNNNYIIDDVDFIDKYVGIPSKRVLHINPYVGMTATISTMLLSALTLSKIDHKYNPDLYNDSSISVDEEDTIDDSMLVYDTNEPLGIEDAEANLLYYPTDDTDKPHVILFSDNDDKLEDTTNEFNIVSSNDPAIYEFNNEDKSNSETIKLIDLIYGPYIKPLAYKYGFDYELILAMICQENGAFSTRQSTQGGVGPLQVEWYIHDGEQIEDIDGSTYTFNCANLNNISNDFGKMYEISLYKQIFEDQSISKDELSNNNIKILELLKYNYSEEKYNNLIQELNNFDSLVNNATSFEEAKNQALICLNITSEDINQFDNAIEGVHAGEILLNHNINSITDNNKNNVYGYKLSNNDIGLYALWAYNKGETCINNYLMSSSSNEETNQKIIDNSYGDDNYIDNIFSYLKSDSPIHMKNKYGDVIAIQPTNLFNNKIK